MTNSPKSTAETEREVERLRNEARYAYLDGKTARSRQLNHQADLLARKLRRLAVAA